MTRVFRPRRLVSLVLLALLVPALASPLQARPAWEGFEPWSFLTRWFERIVTPPKVESQQAADEGDILGSVDPDGAPRTNQAEGPEGDFGGNLDPDGAP